MILSLEWTLCRADLEHSDCAVGLVRMSRKGKVIWEAPHEHRDLIGDPAVSATVFYYNLRSPSTNRDVFVARNVDDGTVVLQKDVPIVPTKDSTCRPQLFGNAQWAAVHDADGTVFILESNTGKIVSYFGSRLYSRLSISSAESRFWSIGSSHPRGPWLGYEKAYDANAESFKDIYPVFKFDWRAESFIIGYDGDRRLSFHLKISRQCSTLRLSISSEFIPAHELIHPRDTEGSLKTVTLPRSSEYGLDQATP